MSSLRESQLIGKTINNRYRVEKEIGNGAVANVYRGTDLKTNTVIAIKQLMDTAQQADEAQITRFERESNAMETLSHPSIVNVIDTLFVGGDHLIVMDYVAGGSLGKLLAQEGKLDMNYAIKIAHDIASAMIVVHDEDIIHRDIKPDNILISREGTARLTDFGMARFTYLSRLTTKDIMLGSMLYMSPEQFKTGEAVKKSDIWAFGVTLYEIIVGKKPFLKPQDVILSPHVPVITARPEASQKVSDFVDKLLEKDARKRIPDFDNIKIEIEILMKSPS
jgi:eukaryotic-like serine/threonine-protein kinase